MLPCPRGARACRILAVVLAVLSLVGCASERKPINKVQANALEKKFFIGDPGNPSDDPVFFWRNFVVDGSEAQELIGVGSWSGVDRIRWDITESTLYARRAYDQNPGSDGKGSTSTFPDGTVVAAYPILSHFDIKRAYNPQTGEELNVIEENTTDRPWYERSYFRVDWSLNQVESPQWTDMFIEKMFDELKLTPVAYYVSDPTHDDAPHFDAEDGYFDVTSKFLVEPLPSNPEKTPSEGASIPSCAYFGLYTGTAIQNCDAQEAVIRSSYWRVDRLDPDGDFEPFENTRAPEDVLGNPGGLGDSITAGILTPPRVTWDPGYGYTDEGMKRYFNIHNLWQQSHQTRGTCTTDADCAGITHRAGSTCLPSGACSVPCSYAARGDGTNVTAPNGTDDQCENQDTGYQGSAGSQCSAKNRCTIPYRDRKVRPIAFWVNPDMPDDFQNTVSNGKVVKGPTEEVIDTWNQAVNLAVAHAREVECRRTGGNRDSCHATYIDPDPTTTDMVGYGAWGIEHVKKPEGMVITCHNPVRDDDPEACGERGTTARVGDVRRHFIFYWPFASRVHWGGIANFNGDPLTGQMIGASATVMGRSATYAAAMIRDILLVSNNELSLQEITGGVPASLFEQRLKNGEPRRALSADEMARRVGSLDLSNSAALQGSLLTGTTPIQRLASAFEIKTRTSADPGLLWAAVATADGTMAPLKGTEFEAKLLNPSWLADATGMDPNTPIDDAVLARASPLRGRDPWKMTLINRQVARSFAQHGICDFAGDEGVGNPDIRGVAKYFGDPTTGIYNDAEVSRRFPKLDPTSQEFLSARAGLIYDDLTKEAYKGILLHEVGHALGLLHNFASSYDATNYNPQYWQLRTNEGAAVASCAGQPRTGSEDSCMGPRFLDPETDDELGQADESRPGINYFANTSTMEYQNERFFESVGLGQYDVMAMGALYGRVLETFDPDARGGVNQGAQQRFVGLMRSQLIESNLVDWQTPFLGSGVQPMHYTELARQLHLFDVARCRKATDDELRQGRWRIVHGKVCSGPPKDHAAWGDFVAGNLFGGGDVPKAIASADAPGGTGNVRWPYRYGETDNAYIHVNPSDAGADAYEVTRETIRKFDYGYPFSYFRRQRRDWLEIGLPSVTADRFYERLRSYHWVLARSTGDFAQMGITDLEGYKAQDDVARSQLLAETDMFDAIVRSIVTPQIGDYAPADPSLQLGVASGSQLFDFRQGGLRNAPFTLDASSARFVDLDVDSSPTGGGSWDYNSWVTHAGFYVEKSDATLALADGRPTLAIITRDTYIDDRFLNISFRTDLARGVDRLLGGVIAGDWQGIAGSMPPGATAPEYLHLAEATPARSDRSRLVFPNLGYIQQLGAIIWGEVYSRQGTDLSLTNKMLVYLEGTQGVIEVPDSQKIKFTDPSSGFTYVARRYGPDTIDGRVVDGGIGARMLTRANELLAKYYQVEVDAGGAAILDAYGRPTLVLDAGGNPVVQGDSTLGTALRNHVGLVDTVVQVARLVGHGPL